SLRELYLRPLETERDGGATLRETLRAHLSAAGNVSSAASALGVSRRTVSRRIRAIEEKLSRRLMDAGPEVEIALRLGDLEQAGRGSSRSN
ncbi:MAG TPA: helix-turn-helix domain-containing protein, partial [Solirubrobacterales bacterium]